MFATTVFVAMPARPLLPLLSRSWATHRAFQITSRPLVLAHTQNSFRCQMTAAANMPSAQPSAATESSSSNKSSSDMFAKDMTFGSLGVTPVIADRLGKAGLNTPTNAQVAIIPLLLDGLSMQMEYASKVREFDSATAQLEEVDPETVSEEASPERPSRSPEDVNDVLMFGAETGCGKTLAYLLPYIQAVRDSPINMKAIILVPSRELCIQIGRFLQIYFDDPPSHIVLAGGNPLDVSDAKSVHVVIATPAALLNHLRFSQKADVSDKMIIIDEADMLLTGSYLRDIEEILDQPGMKPFARRRNGEVRKANGNRLVFVGATYPHWTGEKVRSIITWMKQRYPTVRSVQTGDIHRRNTGLQSRWYHISTELERVQRLAEIMREDVAPGEKVMVFCSKADTVKRVHRDLITELSLEKLSELFGSSVELHKMVQVSDRADCLKQFRDGNARLLFCTDLASRGLDLGDVTRVIEFDFATNVVAYLHRIGRTARAGAKGCTDHFYDDVSKPLADAVRAKAETESTVVESIFSRRRGFRRKLKKAAALATASAEASAEPGAGSSKSMDNVEIDEMTEEEKERWNSET